jgi:SAM-dependent methyltransferase
MSPSADASEKPPTLKSSAFRNWVRVNLLSPYLKAIPREEKTLDLACGWGFYFQINPNAFGLEIDEACVDHLQRQGRRVKRGSLLEPFPFEEGSFDNCISHDVLEHFEGREVPLIFANAHRVLRPGGRFMNVIPNRRGYDFGVEEGVGHKHFVTPEEIARIAGETGFSFESCRASPLPAFAHRFFTHNKWVTLCRKL